MLVCGPLIEKTGYLLDLIIDFSSMKVFRLVSGDGQEPWRPTQVEELDQDPGMVCTKQRLYLHMTLHYIEPFNSNRI